MHHSRICEPKIIRLSKIVRDYKKITTKTYADHDVFGITTNYCEFLPPADGLPERLSFTTIRDQRPNGSLFDSIDLARDKIKVGGLPVPGSPTLTCGVISTFSAELAHTYKWDGRIDCSLAKWTLLVVTYTIVNIGEDIKAVNADQLHLAIPQVDWFDFVDYMNIDNLERDLNLVFEVERKFIDDGKDYEYEVKLHVVMPGTETLIGRLIWEHVPKVWTSGIGVTARY
jgi:hypothetical protein